VALGACAPRDPTYDKLRAMSAAQAHFGRTDEVKFFEVASAGALRDSAVVALSVLGMSTSAEDSLAALIERAGPRPVRLAVTGPVPAKTYRVLLGVLDRSAGRGLSNVQLLLIGPPDQAAELREAALAAGMHFHFIPFATHR
jgi:hypothetical protein